MKILGLYTHLNSVHVCISTGAQFLHEEKFTFEERSLSTQLPILLKEIGDKNKLNCIALQNGPDAFTSLRVTLAFVQGLCTGWGIPVYVCSHFELLKNAYHIQNGMIIIQNKAALLPAVQVKDGVLMLPIQLPAKDSDTTCIRPNENDGVNLGKVLCEMAMHNQFDWIKALDLSPNYCFVPSYKKIK